MALSDKGRYFLICTGSLLCLNMILSFLSVSLSVFVGSLLILMYGILNIVCMTEAYIDIAKDIFNITSANDTWQNWLFWWFVTFAVFMFLSFIQMIQINSMNKRKKRRHH